MRPRASCRSLAATLLALACAALSATTAQAEEPARRALKVCQDPNNLPFSKDRKSTR